VVEDRNGCNCRQERFLRLLVTLELMFAFNQLRRNNMTSANNDDPFNSSTGNEIINNNYGVDDESLDYLGFDDFGVDESREGANPSGAAVPFPPPVKPSFPDAKKLASGTEEMNMVRLCLVALSSCFSKPLTAVCCHGARAGRFCHAP
jgi:hypothetical protein